MAFPNYIPTRRVSIGGAMAMESGQPLIVQASVISTKSLVWNPTGYRFEKTGIGESSSLGGEVVFELPCTDTNGWRDPATNNLIDVSAPGSYSHMYTVTAQIGSSPAFVVGPFVLPAGDGSVVDLDKFLPVGTTEGQQVLVPDSWSQQVGGFVTTVQQSLDQTTQQLTDMVDQAVSDIVNETITVTDPIITGVISDPGSDSQAELRQLNQVWVLRGPGIDPTGAADSTTALNAMMTLAAGNGIYTCILPAGNYLVNGPVRIPGGVTLRGHGQGVTNATLADGSEGRLIYLGNRSDIIIEDITFKIGAVTGAAAGLRFDAVNRVTVRNCELNNSKQGIMLLGTGEDVTIENVRFTGDTSDYAVRHLSTDANYKRVSVRGITVESVSKKTVNSPSAVIIGGGEGHIVEDITVLSTADTGVMITKGKAIRVRGNKIKSSLVSIYLGSGASDVECSANTVSSDSDFGFHVLNTPGEADPGSNARIIDNTIAECGKSAVYVEGYSDVKISGNDITNVGLKSIMGSGTPIPEYQRDAISIVKYGTNLSKNPVITDNNVKGSSHRYGLRIESGTAGAVVDNNNVESGTAGIYNIGYPLTAPYEIRTNNRRISSSLSAANKNVRNSGSKSFSGTTWTAGSDGNFDIAKTDVRPGDRVEISLSGLWQAGGTQTTHATMATIVNDQPVNNIVSGDPWPATADLNTGAHFLTWDGVSSAADKMSGSVIYDVKDSDLPSGVPGVFRVRLYCKQSTSTEARTLLATSAAPLIGSIVNLSA